MERNEQNYIDFAHDLISDLKSIHENTFRQLLKEYSQLMKNVTPIKFEDLISILKDQGMVSYDIASQNYKLNMYVPYEQVAECPVCTRKHDYASEAAACILVFGKCCITESTKTQVFQARQICERRMRIKHFQPFSKKILKAIVDINNGKISYHMANATLNGINLDKLMPALILDYIREHPKFTRLEMQAEFLRKTGIISLGGDLHQSMCLLVEAGLIRYDNTTHNYVLVREP